MRDLSKTEVEKMLVRGRALSEDVITALLDEFQKEQPEIYEAIFGEFSDAIAEDSQDMSNLFVDICCDIIWIYREAFGKPPINPNAEQWICDSVTLLDAELKALSDEFPMNGVFRFKLRERFERRSIMSGVQMNLLNILHDEVEKYASFKRERQRAIGPTFCFLFVIVRLMNELYNQKELCQKC